MLGKSESVDGTQQAVFLQVLQKILKLIIVCVTALDPKVKIDEKNL